MLDKQKEDKATPRPWTWTKNEIEDGDVIDPGEISDANGNSIFTLDAGDYSALSDETTALIVEAVNNYDALKKKAEALDALVEACDGIDSLMNDGSIVEHGGPTHCVPLMVDGFRLALKKVKESSR